MSNRDNAESARLGVGPSNRKSHAVVQVSMTAAEKQRFMQPAKGHGLGLSAFLRMAANDYMQRNDWE